MQDELMIKYIKKKKEKGMEILIDSYRGIITSVVRKHLGVLVNYEEECVDDVLLSIWNNIADAIIIMMKRTSFPLSV